MIDNHTLNVIVERGSCITLFWRNPYKRAIIARKSVIEESLININREIFDSFF